LSTTVAGLAYQTRDSYPVWFVVAVALAVSIVGATMYLGIHWATDVLAGFVLAAIALWVARRYGDRDLLDR
jgi:membrane-associated phospholipid phosphatase